MKILQIHKYFSRKRGGGSVTAFFQTKKLLESKGHKVIIFSMQDEENEKTVYNKYFIKNFDINKAKNPWDKISWAFKSIFNFEAQRKLAELIEKEKPDVAHIHNVYHYLTPSIFHTLKKNNIPMVFKLSDYKAICPNYKLFNKGEVCEKCKGGKYYNCFLNRCLKNSWSISFIAMKEAYVHKFLRSYQKIDFFLAPSEFMKRKCVEFGISVGKIKILRNVVDVDDFSQKNNSKEKNYFLYYGRISEEKGLEDLIKAFKISKNNDKLKGNRLKIVGQGPYEDYLKNIVKELGLEEDVIFLGFKEGEKLIKIIQEAKFVVLPSVWYDNSPLVISEAQLLEKPMLVSDRGGSKEMIIEDETGLIFKTGNLIDLSEKIEKLLKATFSQRKEMGKKGRENIKKLNDKEKYYQKLIGIYKDLISK